MNQSILRVMGIGAFFGLVFFSCKENPPKPDISAIPLFRGDLHLCGSPVFGKVDFDFTCDEASRETFELGIALLHSFEYEEAEKAFVKVIDADPQCVMAYWGVAMSNFHSLWIQNGTEYLEKGNKILKAVDGLSKTGKEADYIDAISIFYQDYETKDRKSRIALFEQKMEALYNKYHTDREAAIIYALSLCAAADPNDKTYSNQLKSGSILESLLKEEPDHPGIAHYIIHNYDTPELAALALPTARKYAKIAPASAHAQHMPSHIFTRLGLWDEAIASNLNSTASALCYSEIDHPNGHWDEELHGMDYLVYAYLQIGDDQKAKAQEDYLTTFKEVYPVNFKVAYAVAAIPSRLVLETRNWKGAAQLQLPPIPIDWDKFPWQRAIYHFTRSLGAARSGNVAEAEKELDILNHLHQKLSDQKEAYSANQVAIQIKTAQAWIQHALENQKEAIALMTEAAIMENGTNKHPVTPGEVLPAEELLADLLLACGKPEEALAAYKADLQGHPNRLNGLYGAAVAAKQAGDRASATDYFNKLIDLTQGSLSERREIAIAKAFLKAIP
jgi:hypothetical protein